jgi:DNA-binding LytR/AlgR family response regulator
MAFKNKIYDLILFDIVMPGKNGIESAKELRRSGYEGEIIFMTSNTEYALEAYDVYPLTFLQKPFTYEKTVEVMKKFFSKGSFSSTIVIRNNDGAKEVVPMDSILYVESQGHSVCYALENGCVYTAAGNFTKAIGYLPEYFFRCHRCYAVNMKKAKTIQRYYFVLENDIQIPISKGEFKEAQKRFVYNS